MSRRRRNYTHGAHIFRRSSGIWYSRVPGAKPAEQSLHTRDRAEAERAHAARIAAAVDGSTGECAPATPRAARLVDLAEAYLTAEHDHTPRTATSARLRVLAFLRWCSEQSPPVETVSDLTHTVLDAWIAARRASKTRRGTPLTSTTLARDWKMVRRWLRWCVDRELCGPTPFASRRAPKEPRRASAGEIPSPQEIARVAKWLRSAKQPGGAAALVVLLATGFRRSELRDLPETNVAQCEIKTPPGKGKRERVLVVARAVVRAAREYLAARAALRGKRRHADPSARLDDHWSARVLHPACDACKLPRFGAHDVRRTFATECVRSGVDILTVQQWLGHRNVTTTHRYLGRYRNDRPAKVPTPRALTIATPKKGRKR